MRLVRQFACLLALSAVAVVPLVGVGCSDQSTTSAPTSGERADASKKTGDKPSTPKAASKKGRSSEAGSTTGDLGVKPPKAPATDSSKK